MASGQFVTVKLMRGGNDTPWGFRLQGGLEFGIPLSVVKVTNGSLAEQGGVQIGDILLKINGKECENIRHKEAQDVIISAGNYLELYLERGPTNTWRPSVTPVGDVRLQSQQTFTKTSLTKSPESNVPIGSGHNSAAKPFANSSSALSAAGTPPKLVHKQFNSPVNLYSEKNIEETLNAHAQVLATGATGINFIKPDAPVNKESAVYQMVHDEEMRKSKGISGTPEPKSAAAFAAAVPEPNESVIKHVNAPFGKPNPQAAADNLNRNICSGCERLITGVFVRINNKSLHAECFCCATCGSSLKNTGYFNVNDKLYCDIHARQVKTVLGSVASVAPQSAPSIIGQTLEKKLTNGYSATNGISPVQATAYPESNIKPAAIPIPVQNETAAYQQSSYQAPIMNNNISQNGFNNYSTLRKFTSVTAPKPSVQSTPNRNSVYVSNPSSAYAVESYTAENFTKPNFQPPPPSNVSQNVVTYRQTVQHHERPKSCFNLPSYSVTSTTCTTTNYGPPGGSSNANLQFPKTATFASSTQSATQKYSSGPGIQQPQQPAVLSNYSAPNPSQPLASTTTNSTTTTYGKQTATDSKSAPRRGRGFLQNQLSGGVVPFCGYCSQPIRGQYIMALNKSWCPNHFICANSLCKRSLEENGFVEEQGRLYCEACYETHFAPACAKCIQRIKGDCLNALDKQWHPNCFACSYCKKPFGNSSFYLEDGLPYCEKDWNDLFTTKCVGCKFPIAAGDRWVEALNQNYHSNCFKCTVCHNNLEGQSFFAKGGRPFCRAHAR